MENGNNHIKQFTAADIEKYHEGKLSSAEMHAMEKAAMDDPFLADALEGYAVAGVDVKSDLAELQQRLEKRTGTSKVIPISGARNRNFNLLRAAVAFIFIAGAALLVYQFGFNNNQKKEIAQAKSEDKTPPVTTDSSVSAPVTANGNVTSENKNVEIKVPVSNDAIVKTDRPARATSKPVVSATEEKPAPLSTERGLDMGSDTEDKPAEPKTAPVITRSADEKIISSQAAAKKEKNRQEAEAQRKEKDDEYYARQQAMNQPAGAARREMNVQFQANNFRGRVTDAGNVGVPFANVTNLSDNNAGTYTDAKGYFNLTYPDSVLTVQVKSIGFENTNVRLRNNVPTNQVVLKDDRSNLDEVVLSKQTNTAQRKAYDNLKVEEPEPADGWEKYDAYLLNNINKPGDGKDIPKGTVEVSLEVNKNGEPTNLKVEKSLCSSCDKEALRLIKEGPKWKRKAKKGRTTVKIPF